MTAREKKVAALHKMWGRGAKLEAIKAGIAMKLKDKEKPEGYDEHVAGLGAAAKAQL